MKCLLVQTMLTLFVVEYLIFKTVSSAYEYPKETSLRIGIPLAMILASILSQDLFKYQVPASTLLLQILRISISIAATFELGRLVCIRTQHRLPLATQASRRLLTSYLAVVIICFVVITVTTLVGRTISPKPVSLVSESVVNFIQCIWIAVLIVVPAEAFYNYKLLFAEARKKEELHRLNLLHELNHLRERINPHFIFNSLNTLVSLIKKRPNDAEEYVLQLSTLYRYISQHQQTHLITLEQELKLIDAFIHLQKVRFGNALLVIKDIPGDLTQSQLPPLSLQVLVENSIKHNEVSIENPLTIRIQRTSNQLIVTNNLQVKTKVHDSTMTGLTTLVERYKLLQLGEVLIESNESEFKVTLPLAK